MVDALDEAQQPLSLARSLLSRMAGLEGVRLIVGTRRSGPDQPPSSTDLLDALLDDSRTADTIVVSNDSTAVRRYVRHRLERLVTEGRMTAGRTMIIRVADLVSGLDPEFLYARLAVHELRARPSLLEPENEGELTELLNGDQQRLFGAAVERLTGLRPSYRPLLTALAHRLGRGLPSRDLVWTTVATALSDSEVPESDLNSLLTNAAPYVMLDAEAEHSVYRLAHQTFQDLLLRDETDEEIRAAHSAIADALVALADSTPPDEPINPYLATYLSGHVAKTGPDAWWDFARKRAILDRLDAHAVTADAFRTLFGRHPMPPEIAGLMGTRHLMRTAKAHDRRGLREVGMARYAGIDVPRRSGARGSAWWLAWAHIVPRPTHMTLEGHTGPVEDVVPAPRGRVVSASVDATVRVWDAATGTQLNVLRGHSGPVRAVAMLGGTQLISGGDDKVVIIWDLNSDHRQHRLDGHSGPIRSVAALADGRVASASHDNTIRLWDIAARTHLTLTGHTGPVEAIAATPDGTRLVSAGVDGTVRVWDIRAGTELDRLNESAGPVRCVTVSGEGVVVVGAADGTIGWWNPGDNTRRVITGHTGSVDAVAVTADRRIVSASADATVRVWDPQSGAQLNLLDGHDRRVLAVTVTTDGQIISGGVDATVRIWDSATSTHLALEGHAVKVESVVITANDRRVVYGGHDSVVRVCDSDTGTPLPGLRGHVGPVWAVAASPDGQTVVTGGDDWTIRVWSTESSQALVTLNGHTGAVRAVAVTEDGRIISAGDCDLSLRRGTDVGI